MKKPSFRSKLHSFVDKILPADDVSPKKMIIQFSFVMIIILGVSTHVISLTPQDDSITCTNLATIQENDPSYEPRGWHEQSCFKNLSITEKLPLIVDSQRT